MRKLNPPQILAASFLCVILLGAAALSLPQATTASGGISFIDSLFTSTSAVCVTGLTVVDTGSAFSGMGTWVIFALFQAGGLGIMTFSMFFAVLMGRKIGFNETDVIQRSMDKNKVFGLEKLILYILALTAAIELAGAALLFLRWKIATSWPAAEVLKQAVFHSVSGFCNAGFSLFPDSLSSFRADPFVNLVMMGLIVSGGIGFVVLMDAAGLFYKKAPARKMSLQSKIALATSFLLILFGALMILFFEKNNVLKHMGAGERVLSSLFQSVSARTAGFNTVSIAAMALPSQIVLLFLMFIGASPGSTGGGIKTCTFAILVIAVYSIMKDKKKASVFGRSLPSKVIMEMLVIVFLAVMWVFTATLILAYLERNNPAVSGSFLKVLFEVVSAFGTVGLSTGITPFLSWGGKVCMIATMYAGRIGPLTLALAVAFKEKPERYTFPEEDVMIG